MLKFPELTDYFYKAKVEIEKIEDKTIEEENKEKKELEIGEQNKNNEKEKAKKKERRKNPNSQINENEEDAKLLEDSSLNGIVFSSFNILQTLGSGTFGKVYKVELKSNGNIYAMKIINKKYLIRNQQLRYAVTECNVLKQTKHPFIITLHYAFQTPDHLYMILDYCPGGDFSFHIARNLFEEDEAKFFIAELVLAIEHLHNLDIIYRDLKPENILIDSDGHIRLADFGLAKENVSGNKMAQSFCGSPAYLAPEMVNRRGAGKSSDIYGIGAVLYEMISGTPPFYANDLNTMYKNISRNNLMLHDYF
jgi:serine/threonine protein kinase